MTIVDLLQVGPNEIQINLFIDLKCTAFHLGVEYVGSNFVLDAVYEPESSFSSSPFRGLSGPTLPGSGRNSVSSDRVTFAATFNW